MKFTSVNPLNKRENIVSIDVEKCLKRIQYLFLVKHLIKLERELSQPERGHIWKPMADIIFTVERRDTRSLRSGTGMLTLSSDTQHCTQGPSLHDQAGKERKGRETWKA